MIETWEHFFFAVKEMRKHQGMYFQTKDRIALGRARKFEKPADERIAEREARMNAQNQSHTGGS